MSSGWKRSSGQFSSKAKKEYLQWKRSQKRESSEGNSEDEQIHEATASRQPADVAASGRRAPATPNDEPLRYVDLERLGGPEGSAQLPRCVLEEVGMAATAPSLGMPQRPAWRGAVHSADQLQQLEESSFTKWLQEVDEKSSDLQPAFFEKRLEFWRQLWRVLDRSHVVLMLLDARNPLFHFSEALYTHAMEDLGLPVVLVLNKCDLVPAAAVAAWHQWFAAAYPKAKVVSASAAAKDASDCATRILEAVLDRSVNWGGATVKAREVVNMAATDILQESRVRNAPNRSTATGGRHGGGQPAAGRQPVRHMDSARERHAAGGASQRSSVVAAAAVADVGDEGDGAEEWQLKGTKARRKAAVKAKRSQRQAGGAAQAAAETQDGEPRGARGAGGRAGNGAAHQSAKARKHGHAGEEDDGSDGDDDWTASASAGEDDGRRHRSGAAGGRRHGGAAGAAAALPPSGRTSNGQVAEDSSDEEGASSDGSDAGEDGRDNANQEFEGMGDDVYLPQDTLCGSSNAGASTTAGVRGGTRPLVVCVCGEPNVGKSSIMNVLLGSHKVAVSSHPGRTKHYQTHYMTSRLMLCDCPGLVFPRTGVPLPMQVLYGSFPIARCRDPYSVVQYLAERMWPRIPDLFGLTRELAEKGETQCPDWSTQGICEALAVKQSWRSKRSGRLDTYKAANWLLRSALAGRNGVNLCFLPPAADVRAAQESAVVQAAVGPAGGDEVMAEQES